MNSDQIIYGKKQKMVTEIKTSVNLDGTDD